jgi:hypothetical protein
MQKSMGYNSRCSTVLTPGVDPVVRNRRVPSTNQVAVPVGLPAHLPGFSWGQVAEISVLEKEVVRANSWILVICADFMIVASGN